MNLFWTFVALLVCVFLAALAMPVHGEKYRWEGYPWPSYAGKPSREKPMRRDLSEKLEFGEMYPEGSNKAANVPSKVQKSAKNGHKPAKSGHKAAQTRPRDAAPPLPERRPPWYQRIFPSAPPPPPAYIPPEVPEMEAPEPPPPVVVSEPWSFDIQLFSKWITFLGLGLLTILGILLLRSR